MPIAEHGINLLLCLSVSGMWQDRVSQPLALQLVGERFFPERGTKRRQTFRPTALERERMLHPILDRLSPFE